MRRTGPLTKVNRAITEGRRRFMEAYGALEAGEECERFAPILRALAAGTASSQQLVEVRPHLRRCTACRAMVRDLHMSGLRRVRLLIPVAALVTPLRWARDRLGVGHGPGGAAVPGVGDGSAAGVRDGGTAAGNGGAVDPTSAADLHFTPLHGPHLPPRVGDATLPPAGPSAPERLHVLHRAKQHATSLLHRTNSSDLAAGIHIAATSGGGRSIATLGAVLGLCLSGVGAGTVCVVTGVIEAPFGLFDQRHGAVVHTHPHVTHEARAKPARSGPTLSADRVAVRAAATPTPTPTPPPTPNPTPLRRPSTSERPASRARPSTPVVATATPDIQNHASPTSAAPLEFGPEPSPASTAQSTTAAPTPPSINPSDPNLTDAAQQEFGP